MTSSISISDKKEFIKWFLNQYSLKRREATWILNYIMSNENILENVHFVNDVSNCQRAIIMSTHCSDNVPFRFHKDKIISTDAEKAFHDIRLNRQEDLYIELHFKNKKSSSVYVGILEDNPYLPEDIPKDEVNTIVNSFMDYCLSVNEQQKLKQQIDEALDKNDKDEFNRLTAMYNKIKISDDNFTIIKR